MRYIDGSVRTNGDTDDDDDDDVVAVLLLVVVVTLAMISSSRMVGTSMVVPCLAKSAGSTGGPGCIFHIS